MTTYISEIRYRGKPDVEFVEIAVPAGTDVSSYSLVLYDSDGTVTATFSLGLVQSTVAGNDVYLINDATSGFLVADTGSMGTLAGNMGVALVDDTSMVLQFLSFDGPTFDATEGPTQRRCRHDRIWGLPAVG